MNLVFEYTHKIERDDSSVIEAVHYNRPSKDMVISFVNGKHYHYEDVAFDTYAAAVVADSIGQWYNYDVLGAGITSVEQPTDVSFTSAIADAPKPVVNIKNEYIIPKANIGGVTTTTLGSSVKAQPLPVYQIVWELEGKMRTTDVPSKSDELAVSSFESAIAWLGIDGQVKTVMRHYV